MRALELFFSWPNLSPDFVPRRPYIPHPLPYLFSSRRIQIFFLHVFTELFRKDSPHSSELIAVLRAIRWGSCSFLHQIPNLLFVYILHISLFCSLSLSLCLSLSVSLFCLVCHDQNPSHICPHPSSQTTSADLSQTTTQLSSYISFFYTR